MILAGLAAAGIFAYLATRQQTPSPVDPGDDLGPWNLTPHPPRPPAGLYGAEESPLGAWLIVWVPALEGEPTIASWYDGDGSVFETLSWRMPGPGGNELELDGKVGTWQQATDGAGHVRITVSLGGGLFQLLTEDDVSAGGAWLADVK